MFQNSPFIAVKKVPVEKRADVLDSVEDHIKIHKLCSLSIFLVKQSIQNTKPRCVIVDEMFGIIYIIIEDPAPKALFVALLFIPLRLKHELFTPLDMRLFRDL